MGNETFYGDGLMKAVKKYKYHGNAGEHNFVQPTIDTNTT